MRYALIIVFGVCYYAGWLPASFVVPALLVISALRLPNRSTGRTPRRGGYIHPPSNASSGASPATVDRVRTYTDSFRQPGPQSEVRTAFTTPLGASRTTVPGSYMSAWGFGTPGVAGTAVDLPRAADFKTYEAWMHAVAQADLGDCGCGDTAA